MSRSHPLLVGKRARDPQQPQTSVHGQDQVPAEEGFRSEKRRLWLLLRFRRPLCFVRLPESESFTSNRCGYLGPRRRRWGRLPRPAIMPGIIDSKTGKSIIHGKTVTGFTIEGELIFRILDKLRADGVVPVVEAVTAAGAFYSGSIG